MPPRTATLPDAESRHIVISVNPRAGARWRCEQVNRIEQSLKTSGYEVSTTSDRSELIDLTAGSSRSLRAVVALGGDGTAAFVRNLVPLEIPLLPVPAGTENLLGRFISQTNSPAAVCTTIDEGVIVGLDLGRAGDRYFLMMISVGFDAEVIRRLHESRRGNITRLAYLIPALHTFRSYEYPEMQVYCEGDGTQCAEPLSCRWLFGFNLPLYACGWQISPDADATDSMLDLCAFERGSWPNVLRYLWHVTLNRHHTLADAIRRRGRRFRIEAAGVPNVAYQLDGDLGGTLPVEVDVLPGKLRLIVTRAVAARLGFALPENLASTSNR